MNRHSTPKQVDSQWQHRIRNALLLSTYAEALATPFAGKPLPEVESVTHALAHPDSDLQRPGCGSAQTLVMARHLAAHAGTVAEDALAIALANRCGTHARTADSTGSHKVLIDIANGIPWWESAPSLHHRQGSYGNDAAVRASPIGLLPRGTPLATIASLARRSATVTHTHQLARDGAAIQAVAVALAARGHPSPNFDANRFLAAITEQTRTPELRAALGIVRTLIRHRAGAAETAATVGNANTALRSVPAALTAFLRYPEDPIAVIRYAILIGGHTTAIAAMAGALAGSRCPGITPPASWTGLGDALGIRLAAADLTEEGQQ